MGTDNIELSRIDYLILKILKDNNSISPISGITIKELGITEVQRTTIWKHINFLIEHNLVCQSGYYGRQKMYYITELGLSKLID